MKNSHLLLLLLFITFQVTAQLGMTDSVVVYDLATNTKSVINPIPVTSSTSQHTGFSYGSIAGTQSLPTTTPSSNLIPNTIFTKISKTSGTFNVQQFPARTVVKIITYKGGVSGTLSGMLVSDCFVLTAGHIILNSNANPIRNFSFDSIKILPAFDNGTLPIGISSAWVEKIYLLDSYFNPTISSRDIALLKINQPLGKLLGYTGIGFFKDSVSTKTKLFHKFSYPTGYDPLNPALMYNGDTMYYNYGRITYQNQWLALQGGAAIPGQSGSTFLHFDGTDYFNVGTLSYSSNYLHYRIVNYDYDALRNVLVTQGCSEGTLGLLKEDNSGSVLEVTPNPSSDGFKVSVTGSNRSDFSVYLFDATGKLVLKENSYQRSFFLPRNNLPEGFYSLILKDESGLQLSQKLIIK